MLEPQPAAPAKADEELPDGYDLRAQAGVGEPGRRSLLSVCVRDVDRDDSSERPSDGRPFAVRHLLTLAADFGAAWIGERDNEFVRVIAGGVWIRGPERPLLQGLWEDATIIELTVPGEWCANWQLSLAGFYDHVVDDANPWRPALASFIRELTPELIRKNPLTPETLAASLGTLLALSLSNADGVDAIRSACSAARAECPIRRTIRHRAGEPGLTVSQVAAELRLSERTAHRLLASKQLSFSKVLAECRMDLARRMLESPHFAKVPVSEIGARAGFADPSYFVRAVAKALGTTPNQYRSAKLPPRSQAS